MKLEDFREYVLSLPLKMPQRITLNAQMAIQLERVTNLRNENLILKNKLKRR